MRGQGARRGGGASTRDGHTAYAEQGPPRPHGPTQPEARDPSPTSTAQQARKAAPFRGSAPRAGACATDALKVPDTQPSQPTEREALAAPSPQPAPAQHAACRRAAQHKCHAQDGPDDSPAQRASHEPGHAPGPPAPPGADTRSNSPATGGDTSGQAKGTPLEPARAGCPERTRRCARPLEGARTPNSAPSTARAKPAPSKSTSPEAPGLPSPRAHRPTCPLSAAGQGQCGRAKAPPCELERTRLSVGWYHTGQGATVRKRHGQWAQPSPSLT